MNKRPVSFVQTSLNVSGWLILHAVVFPMALMALLYVMTFWKGGMTPGEMLVSQNETVQREGYVINVCIPAPKTGSDDNPFPVLNQNCTSIKTDAAGYAAYVDKSYFEELVNLWIVMALVFMGMSVLFGRTPWHRTHRLSNTGHTVFFSKPGTGKSFHPTSGKNSEGENGEK
ncbi:conjugal transfer protein TraP [Enterobacter sp. ECC-019]|uniref:conjugal transfer protein TraP n=1 Tax=Enterobacter sp. ECC-019 TaxID=3116478 RepID=UPI003754C0FF